MSPDTVFCILSIPVAFFSAFAFSTWRVNRNNARITEEGNQTVPANAQILEDTESTTEMEPLALIYHDDEHDEHAEHDPTPQDPQSTPASAEHPAEPIDSPSQDISAPSADHQEAETPDQRELGSVETAPRASNAYQELSDHLSAQRDDIISIFREILARQNLRVNADAASEDLPPYDSDDPVVHHIVLEDLPPYSFESPATLDIVLEDEASLPVRTPTDSPPNEESPAHEDLSTGPTGPAC